jgi:hypothetical protein
VNGARNMNVVKLKMMAVTLSGFVLVACAAKDEPAVDKAKDYTEAITNVMAAEGSGSRGFEKVALFGELHVHSRNSFDAFITGVRVPPEDAYRYAKGEAIDHFSGVKIQAKQPLDFMAVTDHAEYLGLLPTLMEPEGNLAHTDVAKELLSGDLQRFLAATIGVLHTLNSVVLHPELDVPEISRPIWVSYVELADQFYEPGKFTTLVAYEWTSIPNSQNMHRNVIFRGTDVPELPFSAFDSEKAEDLWKWLDKARSEGSDVLAIPHNSNVSDGMMFRKVDSWGREFTAEYAAARMRNEPLVEVTQIKGTSETHPMLSQNDEWADFEIMQELLGTTAGDGKIQGSYVREAYLNGTEMQQEKGFNPYKFGLIGASDSHNSSSPVEEYNYTGKIGNADGTPELRRGGSFINTHNVQYSASGLAGVWVEENTREEVFDALKRRETFATSGPRIPVRFFAGEYPDQLPKSGMDAIQLYAKGVPMGSDLPKGITAPRFFASAIQDIFSAPLQRLQIIKGWREAGELKEQVIDIACSDGAVPIAETNRCPDNGASVELETCKISGGVGSSQLAAIWSDPNFDASQYAFYYVRAIENPTCRWSTWDALRNDWELMEGVPATIQERAWSSPIWTVPEA